MSQSENRATARRSAVFWAVGALFVAGLALLRIAAQPLLLAFAGLLFGTALRGLAEGVAGKLRWKVSWSLAACLAALLLLAAGAGLWIVPNVSEQASTLADKLTQSYDALRRSPYAGRLLDGSGQGGQQLGQLALRAAGILASGAGLLGALVFVLFVALYLAFAPAPYRRGALRLVPPARRERAGEVLDALASTLRRWLLGRLVSMTAVGVVTALGLWILGVPLPVTLGLISGLLGFVPNIGPIVSAVPAALLAYTVSPLHVLYVVALYLAINLADGYALTPWVQKKAVALPPALIITGQVVMGALWGVLGVMLATPLLACLLVLTRELYVKDGLERGAGGPQGSGAGASPAQAGRAPGREER